MAALSAPRLDALAVRSARSSIEPTNRVQRVPSGTCADCGTPIVRARGAHGPLPARCPGCTAARRPHVQLRAYLRAAERLAAAYGLDTVVAAAGAAVAALDATEPPA